MFDKFEKILALKAQTPNRCKLKMNLKDASNWNFKTIFMKRLGKSSGKDKEKSWEDTVLGYLRNFEWFSNLSRFESSDSLQYVLYGTRHKLFLFVCLFFVDILSVACCLLFVVAVRCLLFIVFRCLLFVRRLLLLVVCCS